MFRAIVFLLFVCVMFGVLAFGQAVERGTQLSASDLFHSAKARLLRF